jgi:hypothetical protein
LPTPRTCGRNWKLAAPTPWPPNHRAAQPHKPPVFAPCARPQIGPVFSPRGALDRKPKVFPLAPWPVHANIWRVLEKSSGHLPADKQRCFWFRDKKEWPPCSIA